MPRISLTAGSAVMEEGQTFTMPPGSVQIDLKSLGLPAFGSFDPNRPLSNTQAIETPITNQLINFALITLTQPLFTGGMVGGYFRQAKAGVRAAKQGQRARANRVILTVIKRYNDAVIARKLARVSTTALVRLKALLSLVEGIYKAGSVKITKLDYLQTKLMVDTVANFHARLEQAGPLSLEGLAFAVGKRHRSDIRPDIRDFADAAAPTSCNRSAERALRQRPELAQIKDGILAMRAGVGVARSGYYPKVALTAGYLIDDNSIRFTDGHTFAAAIVLNWSLFDGLMTYGKVAEAKAKLERLRTRQRLARRGISLQVRVACSDARRAAKQLKITRRAFSSAAERRELAEQSYRAELVELDEVLKAQLTEALAEAQHLKARRDLSNSTAEFYHHVGDLARYRKGR